MTERIRNLLSRFDVSLKKSLGQYLLQDPVWLERIVAAGEVRSDDRVLEIGPGIGSLTKHLARCACRVVAVELDGGLIPLLEHTLAEFDNVRLVHGDILARKPDEYMASGETSATENYKIVANIPYYITSAILRHVLEASVKPKLLVVALQLEVARRIVALPGDMSVLAVSVQFYGRPQMMGCVPSGAFYPSPETDSAILRIDVFDQPQVSVSDEVWFFQVVRAGFSQRRKQLQNSLASGLGIDREHAISALLAAHVDPSRRAQTLALEEWVELQNKLKLILPLPEI